jgi:putative membrane protein
MMWYYGGAGWVGWLGMALSMIVFWGAIILLVVWAVRSSSHPAEPRSSTALNILQERLAKGEITPEEYNQRKLLIQGAG